jgi:hypothetical protein
MDLNYIDSKVTRLLSEAHTVRRQYKQEKAALQEAKARLQATEKAQAIAQAIAQQIQQSAHTRVGAVVASCLQSVFGADYSYQIEFVRKRGRTEAKLVLLKNGHEVGDPLESDSGGVLDVAGFAQRLSCLRLSKPKLRTVIFLDEPFKNTHSNKYRHNVKEMLEKLSDDFGIQFIVVTGIDDYRIGKVIEL